MNKKLIALAIAGAFAAPMAMAQTANPVTLYGRVHLTFEQVEVKGQADKRTRIQDQASLLGVRGTEDLGGGLKAFFQLETAFNPESASGTFANRNSGVGFQGGWGSVLIGRWDTPFKVATGAIDPFGDVTIAGITMANNDQGNFDRRDANVVQYWSPNWGGFAFRAMYQAEDGKTAAGVTPQDWGASATFSRGPFYLYLAWEKHEDQAGSTATANSEEEGFSVGGSWAIGPVKLGGNYQKYEKTGRTDKESYLANIVWTLGKNQLIYQYQHSEEGAAPGPNQPDCDVNSLAWQYNFSRRTFTQLIYSKVNNNQFANCGSPNSGWGGLLTANGDPQGISFGVRHVF